MSRPATPACIPTRDGVSPSVVALPAGDWPTLLDFLCERLPAVSRDDWQARLAQGEVVDEHGQPVSADKTYAQAWRQHRRLFYWRSLPGEHPIPFQEEVVFQDDWIVVADKPHFLPVTPKGRYLHETLLVRLKRRLGIDTLTPMHRIDRETAGLVVFIIQPHTRDAYQQLLRQRQVHKVYEAMATHRPDVTLPIWRRSRLQQSAHFMAMQEVPGEPNAHTWIECLEVREPWAHYRLSPLTGQRHQLRVHLNAMGMPIWGDRIYPSLHAAPAPDAPPDFSQPLQLLARAIGFTDPITGASRHFESQRRLVWPTT